MEIFLYELSLRYRGYLIVPVECRDRFACAVLDYAGQQITDASIEQDFSSPEAVWIAGRQFVDFDIRRTIQETPELIPLLVRAGAL